MRDRIRAAATTAAPTPSGIRAPQTGRRAIATGWVRGRPGPSYPAQVLNALADQLTPTAAEPVTVEVWTDALHTAGRTVLATVPRIVCTATLDHVIATLPAPRISQGETCGEWALRLRTAARSI
ncbi:hypothetical protein AB0P17_15445 [Streptomyces sp. NPDC088124]|uniref:hypothetical protein n=1 Tax=Streptomyces sp. NPDC088124 TaxID=3154654 RepID=UPI00343B488F